MEDVARRAGVSKTTVSFVLSGRRDMRISTEAQRRVAQAATELGYRPNLTARGLRTSITGTIGLISDTIATTEFAGEVIHGALDSATATGHLLFIAETEGSASTEADVIDGMLDRQVDGMIYATTYTREVEPPWCLRSQPVVLLNCVAEGFGSPCVLPDELTAGRTAARALLNAGHRHGVHVLGGHHFTSQTPSGAYAGHWRMRGIREAFHRAGAQLAGVIECAWEPDEGYQHVHALLSSQATPPKALICCNDRLALGAYQALKETGLTIPANVSLVSFDDSALASWLHPGLTSVALPHYELGRKAVELLVGGERGASQHLVQMPLRTRASIASVAPSSSDGP
jgi:LacI family transcriptional regulator